MAKIKFFLGIIGLFAAISLSNCATTSHSYFSLKNTLSIFLLNDGENSFFSIPVQYIGDYQIQSFEFDSGYISIGDYKISMGRDNISIDVFVNESSDEQGNTDGLHRLVYSEKNGTISISNMDEPLTKNHENDNMFNQYNIIIKNNLEKGGIKKINNEYKKGKTRSSFYLEYTIAIDNTLMAGCGYSDDFELYNGPVETNDWFPPNLEFFRTNVIKN